MGNTIINREELENAIKNLEQARIGLMNGGDCIITELIKTQNRLSGSAVWSGPACDEFTARLGREISRLGKLDDTLVALISHCRKIDGDLESYVRYLQSLFGHEF